MAVTMVSHSCLLVELGTIYNSMVASLYFKSCEATAYLKAIMEVYGKQLQVCAIQKKNQLDTLAAIHVTCTMFHNALFWFQ